ncbi:hypothetical protein GH714_008684 [Hevea brasiliensis]|uniref:Uncharacterized protein n=1 Tax=Hevea brasiliensis TaxID=3981 RepID=A0A6A6LN27_HEVBR|nr:hypothetical protein GH714_008684 [Hevea brasiliensis]
METNSLSRERDERPPNDDRVTKKVRHKETLKVTEVATLTVKASFKDSVLKGLNEDAETVDNVVVEDFIFNDEEDAFIIHAHSPLATKDQNRKHDASKAVNRGNSMGGSQRGKAVVVPDDSANKENDASQTRRSSRGVFFTYLNENNSMGNAVLMKTSLNPMFNSVVKMVEERHVLKTCERDANPSKSSIVPRTMVDSSLVQSNFTRRRTLCSC